MLAEPRRKQKLSIDPQNVNWRHGNNNVGKNLLQKMGWTDGKGIGKREQGSAENIKLRANYSNSGLGADKDKKKEEWIAHHDDFAALLSNLNQGKPIKDEDEETGVKISIQETAVNVKKRITYKFTRGKDLSMATDAQKSAIFGKKKTKKVETIEEEVKFEETVTETKQFTSNNISATDYYAEKMKKWNILMTKKSEQNDYNGDDEGTMDTRETTVAEDEVPRKKKKNKNIELFTGEVVNVIKEEIIDEVQIEKSKKKNRKVKEDVLIEVKEEILDEEPKKSKKSRKYLMEEIKQEPEEEDQEVVVEKKTKKKKKKHTEECQLEDEDKEEVPKKKKTLLKPYQ